MARWNCCNVLQINPQARECWSFGAAGDGFKLSHHETKLPNEALTPALITKDWQTLYRKKLNVAWLPPEKVFLRAMQIPAADAAEAQSMLDLQLEKLSPIPPQQAVWSFELLPGGGTLRTAILVVAERSFVEQFLGKLEEQSYLADRLEVPSIDQVLATKASGTGVWLFPAPGPEQRTCLAAWWQEGTLQNLTLLHIPAEAEAGRYLRDQLRQMAWAGELEGWLTAPPRWHLVASPEVAVRWEPWLREEGDSLAVSPAPGPAELAAMTARRAASASAGPTLLPAEYGARYRQIFIDRIWMRSLGAAMGVVVVGTLIYLAALQMLRLQVGREESQYLALNGQYTNVMKLKAEVQVLQDQVDLQFAALECWKASATLLPGELTLSGISFERGKKVTISGFGPTEAAKTAGDYSEALGGYTYSNQVLFSKVSIPRTSVSPGQGASELRWNLDAELKRTPTE